MSDVGQLLYASVSALHSVVVGSISYGKIIVFTDDEI